MPLGRPNRLRPPARGFTWLWVLAALASLSAGLAAAGPLWREQDQRDREQQLMRLGALYADALTRYYDSSPGGVKHFPGDLAELLEDKRFVGTVRHLRRLYPEPIDPARGWGLVRAPDGGIAGVYSQSDRQPFHTAPLSAGGREMAEARRYSDWKFTVKESER